MFRANPNIVMPTLCVQLVSTESERKEVIQWIMERVEESRSEYRIAAHTFEQFPRIFRQMNPGSDREKARQW